MLYLFNLLAFSSFSLALFSLSFAFCKSLLAYTISNLIKLSFMCISALFIFGVAVVKVASSSFLFSSFFLYLYSILLRFFIALDLFLIAVFLSIVLRACFFGFSNWAFCFSNSSDILVALKYKEKKSFRPLGI